VWFLSRVGKVVVEGHFVPYPVVKTKSKVWVYSFERCVFFGFI